MASSVATFPLFTVSDEEDDTPTSFLKRARALAKEENVSLPKYLAGMLKHALRGDNLANVHFFQDGSGDTYNTDDLDRIAEQSDAESAAGLTTVGETKEELFAHLRELRKAVDAGKEVD
ncbi:MAG: hypothetical protein LBC11_03285 [Puniceicoccales bacterium]|jgi:hypothetical protein|nr:hypothetical protein [Puniceicoccales bacterium]